MKDTQEWMDSNSSATTEEFKSKMKECETILNPFASQMYAEPMNHHPSSNADHVEEVD